MKQLTDTTWQSDNGLITFIFGDCMDVMNSGQKWDLAVVDPPFGIGIDKAMRANNGKQGYKLHRETNWDVETPSPLYFKTLMTVSKNQIIWGGNYFSLPLSMGWIVWNKMQREFTMADGELAWTSFNSALRIFDYARGNESGFAPKIKKGLKNGLNIHPCQKPIALYRWIFKNYAKPTDHILDTHGGSFSSAIAAHMEGLRMTIIELDPEYFHKAITRFATYEAQQTIKFD